MALNKPSQQAVLFQGEGVGIQVNKCAKPGTGAGFVKLGA